MPQCETKYFESLNYEPGSEIEFPAGLPGFENCRWFLPLDDTARNPLLFLQSLEQPGLCFIMLPVLAIDPTYQLTLTEEDLSALALDATRQPVIGQGVLCFAVVAFGADGVPTANLLAPVVISLKNGKAVQQVRDDAVYGCRHPLSPEQSPCS